MSFKTRLQMTNEILNELALVAGTSVQIYNEPFIHTYIQRGFDHVFSKRYWDHLSSTTYHELDGTAGVVTDQIIGLENFHDIKWIREFPFSPQYEIYYFADGLYDQYRANAYTQISGYTGIAFGQSGYEDKRIRFFPEDAQAQIAIRARHKPDDFSDNDLIPFDSLALVHFVTASLLAIDGINPNQQARQDALFNDRYETLVANEGETKTRSQRDNYFYRDYTFRVADTP